MKSITIIGPCYNEEKNIEEYLNRILKICETLNFNYKIILVDDGSTDNTWKIILEKSKINNKIYGIKLSRNFGHQSAILAGLQHANSDYVFYSDVDLQDPPELLEMMKKKIIEENLNVVFGKRKKNNESFFKKISSVLFYKIFNFISDIKINEQTSDFAIIDYKVLNQLKKIKTRDIFLRGLIPWYGFKCDFIEFERENRKKGSSGWSFYKMIDFSLTAFLSYSNLPMRLSLFMSLISILIFFILSIYALFSYITGNVVKGWTSLFLVISFFNTIVFFILGIIGEYVGRLYINTNTPPFIIEKNTNDK